MNVYVVNYKETTLGEDNVMSVDSGICDYGYKNEDTAKKVVSDLANEKKCECIDELGYEEDDVSLSANDDRDYICVNSGSNTFEYWVSLLIVE